MHRSSSRSLLALLALAPAAAAAEPDAAPAAPTAAPAPTAPAPRAALPNEAALAPAGEYTDSVSRRRQLVATAPQAVTIIDPSKVVDSPSDTIPDRLRYEAGIDVYQTRHGQYDVGMRGYDGIDNSRIIVQYDDRSLAWPVFGSVMWIGQFNRSDVARVEIAKGPSSVAYGANAFGGVITIDAREPDDHHRFYSYGSAGYRAGEVDGTALGPIGERFTYKVGAGVTHLDDLPGHRGLEPYQYSGRTRDTGDEDLVAYRWNGALGWKILDGWTLDGEYGRIWMPEWETVDDLDVGSNWTRWTIDNLGARLRSPWGELRWRRSYMDYDYSNQKAIYGPGVPDYGYAQAGFQDVYDTLRGQINESFGDHSFDLGGEYQRGVSRSNLWSHDGVFNETDTWERVVANDEALFAEDQWAFAPRWIATAGARADRQSLVGIHTSPRLAFNYVPDNEQFWLLSLSSGYRLPTLIESYIQQYYFASDPDLNVEKVYSVEVGWQRRSVGQGWKITANAFYNQSNDQIWIMPLPESQMAANQTAYLTKYPTAAERNLHQPGPFFQFQNVDDPVDVLGVESGIEAPVPSSPFTLWTNGTYQRHLLRRPIEMESKGINAVPGNTLTPVIFAFDKELPRDINAPPMWKANGGVRFDRGPIFSGVAVRWVDSREIFTFAYSGFQSRGLVETQKVPAYAALDAFVGWDFSAERDRTRYLRLSVLDAFDSDHYEWFEANHDTLVLANAREQQLTSEMGRRVVLEGGWAF